ncbi:MAG: hypothetical protein NTZ25_01215 [Candidatus Peregrinibacteria bacterium]|nr:hypothetical protein [Candidatus Peregrinibacteria bacterium]
MEWDFTTSQVSIGEVDYKLEDFLRDLRVETDTNFPKYNDEQKERLFKLFYGVMYFKFNGHDGKEIGKTFNVDPEFVEIIVNENKANIEMLGAIIMNVFLKNLQDTNGMLSDAENLCLMNAGLRRFHTQHNL